MTETVQVPASLPAPPMPRKPGGGGRNGTPRMMAGQIARKELADRIVQYKRAGYSYRAIAALLTSEGTTISAKTAHKYVHRHLAEIIERTRATVAEYRQLELERCDRLQAALWEKAIGKEPDVEATFAIMKIMDHRAKLLGLIGPHAQQLDDDGKQEFTASFGTVIDVTPEE